MGQPWGAVAPLLNHLVRQRSTAKPDRSNLGGDKQPRHSAMRNSSRGGRRRYWGVRHGLAACIAAILSGCAAVDAFAPAAIDYNLQAEQIRNQMILLNVIRAAYRKPMQFSDFTTVTGLTTVSVTAGFSLPFAAIPGSLTRTFTALPSGSLTGGPNFTVSILNTKEFYSGILQPIPMQTVTLYLREGLPKEMLLTLLLSDIEYKQNGEIVHAYNSAYPVSAANVRVADFRTLLHQLIVRGLDTENIEQKTPIGPPLAEKDVSSLATLKDLPSSEVLVKYDRSSRDPDLSTAERAELRAKGLSAYYRLEKDSTQYRFCFDANLAQVGRPIADTGLLMNAALVCGAAADVRALAPPPIRPITGAPEQIHQLMFGHLSVATPTAAAPSSASGARHPNARRSSVSLAGPGAGGEQELTITARSVEQLIYYLGEIARAQLGLTGPRQACPVVATGAGASCLFRLSRAGPSGPSLADAISTTYDGTRYSIKVDPNGIDRSSQVLELVSQLLALNNSAKELPAPSIIPVIH